ncbi:MAG: S8 family serine peptidase [Tepidisphaeraceae bacterium]
MGRHGLLDRLLRDHGFGPVRICHRLRSGRCAQQQLGASGNINTDAATDPYGLGIDGLARANPNATLCVSAGNSGPTTNTVGSPGSGYNVITVGALQNDGSNNYTAVASFSSRGAQTYGDPVNGYYGAARAPVDIVAPGTNLTSAYYGGTTGGNSAALGGTATGGSAFYSGGIAGTSFSSPIVAGGVSLMKSAAKAQGKPATALDTRVVKAALLNSATKTTGWNNGQSLVGGVVQTTQSLDYNAGAGALNLDKAYDQYLTGQTDIPGTAGGTSSQPIGWDLANIALGGTTDIVLTPLFASGTTFNATIDWFRAVTYVNTTTATNDGLADLDLEVWNASFTTKYAESISAFNEVEHLSFALPADTTIGLRVVYGGNIYGSLTSETFGLAWAGTTVVPEPTSLAMVLSAGVVALRRRNRR